MKKQRRRGGAKARRLACLIPFLLAEGCLQTGCAQKPADWKQQRQQIRDLAEIASATGATGQVTVHWDGTPSVGMKQDFYVNSGADITASLQFNAKDTIPLSPAPTTTD